MDDWQLMGEAIQEARIALSEGEMPVGAVVARDGRVLSRAHNRRENDADPTAHAEVLALRLAARALGGWRLGGCTLYVTLEPCPMCAGAALMARVERLVYGAFDPAAGCAGSLYSITEDPAFAHFAPADGGLRQAECRALLDAFFAGKRA